MRLKYYFLIAFRNLFRRKVRNFFSIFSLTIAGLLLALLIALSLGLKEFVSAQLGFLSTPENIVLVYPKFDSSPFEASPTQDDTPREVTGSSQPDDFGAIPQPISKEQLEKIKSIDGVSKIDFGIDLGLETKTIKLKGQSKKYEIFPEYNSVQIADRVRLVVGREMTKSEKGVALISSRYLKVFDLEKAEDLLGKTVVLPSKIKDYEFEIVGVLDKSVSFAPDLLVGFEDAVQIVRDDNGDQSLYKNTFGQSLMVIVDDKEKIEQVASTIKKDKKLEATTAKEEAEGFARAIRWFFGILAAIAFGVSSLFVFSTMAVAVKDRTREIGIMKAIGASKSTIRILFSFEAGLLGFVSGVLASLLAFIIVAQFNAYAHRNFLKEFPTFNILEYNFYLPLIVIGITVLVSIIAAFWPSFRASRIDPIKAIRSE